MSQHHDPVHPDSDHLSTEMIADLEEGLLDAESTSHAEHHLTHCAECRQLREELHVVTAALADLPNVTMPADVEARVMAALPTTAVAAVTEIGQARSRRNGSMLGRSLGVAASVAAVMLVGGLMYSIFVADENSSPTTATGTGAGLPDAASPEAIQLASYTTTSSGTDYDAAILDKQVSELLLADTATTAGPEPATMTEATASTAATSTPDTSVAPSESLTPTSTATSSPSSSPTLSPSLTTAPTVEPTDEPSVSPSLVRAYVRATKAALATSPAAAQECLQGYLELDQAPIAIDLGTFDGRPAAVIVLQSSADTNLAQVYVIDPRCTGIGVLLHYAQVPMP